MWNFLSVLLGNNGTINDSDTNNLKNIINSINKVASAAVGIITVAVVGFAIYLAYKFFTADDEGKRKNAKAQLIYAIIGVVVLVAIMILIPVITNAIEKAITNNNSSVSNSGNVFRIFFPKY